MTHNTKLIMFPALTFIVSLPLLWLGVWAPLTMGLQATGNYEAQGDVAIFIAAVVATPASVVLGAILAFLVFRKIRKNQF